LKGQIKVKVELAKGIIASQKRRLLLSSCAGVSFQVRVETSPSSFTVQMENAKANHLWQSVFACDLNNPGTKDSLNDLLQVNI